MKDFFKIRTPLAEEHGAGEQGTPSLVAKYKNATPGQGGSAPSAQQPARKGDKLDAKFEPVKEAAETLDELSKSTLGSYVKKASRDAVITRKIGADFERKADAARSPGMKAASTELSNKYKSKSWKRRDGLDKAVDRLTKEEVDKGEYDYEGQMAITQLQTTMRNCKDLIGMISDDDNMPEWVQSKITLAQDYISSVRDYLQSVEELGEGTESVEELDELNKDTVYSYAKKAEKDNDTKHKELGAQIKAKNPVAANKTAAKIGNRHAGMDRADARLNKGY